MFSLVSCISIYSIATVPLLFRLKCDAPGIFAPQLGFIGNVTIDSEMAPGACGDAVPAYDPDVGRRHLADADNFGSIRIQEESSSLTRPWCCTRHIARSRSIPTSISRRTADARPPFGSTFVLGPARHGDRGFDASPAAMPEVRLVDESLLRLSRGRRR